MTRLIGIDSCGRYCHYYSVYQSSIDEYLNGDDTYIEQCFHPDVMNGLNGRTIAGNRPKDPGEERDETGFPSWCPLEKV